MPQGSPSDTTTESDATAGPDATTDRVTAPDPADTRVDPPFLAGDRASLRSWLELYRQTLPLKVGGLTAEQLCTRSVPPSTLSPIGVVRHLTMVEEYWFQEVALARTDAELRFWEPSGPDEFDGAIPETALEDLAGWAAEVERSRAVEHGITDLDGPVRGLRHGEQLNLRWIYVHLIEEYARHLGHLDLLRECLDGRTGY